MIYSLLGKEVVCLFSTKMQNIDRNKATRGEHKWNPNIRYHDFTSPYTISASLKHAYCPPTPVLNWKQNPSVFLNRKPLSYTDNQLVISGKHIL